VKKLPPAPKLPAKKPDASSVMPASSEPKSDAPKKMTLAEELQANAIKMKERAARK